MSFSKLDGFVFDLQIFGAPTSLAGSADSNPVDVSASSSEGKYKLYVLVVLCQDLKQIKMRTFQRQTNICFLSNVCAVA